MGAFRCGFRERTSVLGVALLLTTGGRAETSAHGQLALLYTSSDLLESGPPSASPSWDKVATLRAEGDSYAVIALAATDAGAIPGLLTSAALRLELGISDVGDGLRLAPRDGSSFLALTGRTSSNTRLQFRVFPLDTNYQRIGFLHALDFGGTQATQRDSVFRGNSGGAPGAELRWLAGGIQLFTGVKWASTGPSQRLWGVLTGGQLAFGPSLRAEGGFGYFQTGATAALPGFVEGASLRLVWHGGTDEPELRAEPLRPPMLRGELDAGDDAETPGAALALEGVGLVERPPAFVGAARTSLHAAPAAGAYGSLRGRRGAAHFAVLWRSLHFVLRNEPRPIAPEALPASTLRQDELSAWLGGSLPLRPEWLVLGTELGLQLPAAFVTPSALPGVPRTLVVGGRGGLSALPVGAQRLPTFSGRLSLRLRASSRLSLAVFVDYRRDPNRTASRARVGVGEGFAAPDGFWLGATGQARF